MLSTFSGDRSEDKIKHLFDNGSGFKGGPTQLHSSVFIPNVWQKIYVLILV